MRHLITILCALCILSGSAAHAAPKPDIVVLVSDDAGCNEFSMHGAMHFPMPRIDSIAANGVRFTQGCTSGTVSPTRAGLLTGRYQKRFGHEFNVPPAYSESTDQTPSLPDARPRSDRFRCGGRESKFLAVSQLQSPASNRRRRARPL